MEILQVLCSHPGDSATALSITALVIFWKKIKYSCIEINVSPAAFLIFVAAICSSHKLHAQAPNAVSSRAGAVTSRSVCASGVGTGGEGNGDLCSSDMAAR